MTRIFETNLQQVRIPPSGGAIFLDRSHIALWTALSGRRIQSLYLQGYGVLFLMKVDFPLSPAREAQQEDEPEKEDKGDEVWENTRRSIYEPEKLAKPKRDTSAPKYDAQKVEDLKTTLVRSLKHAANIRNLRPEESVILAITGGGKSAGVETVVLERGKSDATRRILVHDKNTGITKIVEGNSPDDLGLSSPMVLVIRARKADVDSFARGDLDIEQFRQRVEMLSYPYLGGGSS